MIKTLLAAVVAVAFLASVPAHATEDKAPAAAGEKAGKKEKKEKKSDAKKDEKAAGGW